MDRHAPMDRHAAGLRRPRIDDRPLWDIVSGMLEGPTLLVARDLKLFPLLAGRPRTPPEVAAALEIAPRPTETLLAMCAALGLVQAQDGRYALTSLAEDYLLDDSPTSFGGYLDLIKASAAVYSYEGVKRAVLMDAPQAYDGEDWVKSHEEQAALARLHPGHAQRRHSPGLGLARGPGPVRLPAHARHRRGLGRPLDRGGAALAGPARADPGHPPRVPGRRGIHRPVRPRGPDRDPRGRHVARPAAGGRPPLLLDGLPRLAAGEVPRVDPEELRWPGTGGGG
jgi:hypothetical protein